MRFIDLDHNATSPILPEAWEAMRAAPPGNPASPHSAGRRARQALEDARERIAAALGAAPDEVIFTSGATEANNLALLSWLDPANGSAAGAASHLEHPCVIEPLRHLESRGVAVEWLPVDARGIIGFAGVRPGTQLVCVMLANHETGAIQPVQSIANALPATAALHCDAAQAVGKIAVNFRELGATTLTATAHKFGGPRGIGVLLARRGTRLRPLLFGGHQEQGRRPGTEPLPLAVGMAAALETRIRNMEANHARLLALRQRLWTNLHTGAAPAVLNGPEIGATDVVPGTINVSFPGCRADLLLMALDLAGIACSTGSACSSGSLLPSPVLRAMGLPEEALRSALRFSFCADLDPAELDRASGVICAAVNRARGTADHR